LKQCPRRVCFIQTFDDWISGEWFALGDPPVAMAANPWGHALSGPGTHHCAGCRFFAALGSGQTVHPKPHPWERQVLRKAAPTSFTTLYDSRNTLKHQWLIPLRASVLSSSPRPGTAGLPCSAL
jgi:hypothetical protein